MFSPQSCLLTTLLLTAALAGGQDAPSVPPPGSSAQANWRWEAGQWVLMSGAYQWQAGHWVSVSPSPDAETTSPYVWIPSHWDYLPSGGWVGVDGHYALIAPAGVGQPPPQVSSGEPAPSPVPGQALVSTGVPSRPRTPQPAFDTTQVYDSTVESTTYVDYGVGYYGTVDSGWGSSTGWGVYGTGGFGYSSGYGYGYGNGYGNGAYSTVVVPRSCHPSCGTGAWATTGGAGWAGCTSPNPSMTVGPGGWGLSGSGPYGGNPWRRSAEPGVMRSPASTVGPFTSPGVRPMTSAGHSTGWGGGVSSSTRMSSGSGMGSRGMGMGGRGSFSGGRR